MSGTSCAAALAASAAAAVRVTHAAPSHRASSAQAARTVAVRRALPAAPHPTSPPTTSAPITTSRSHRTPRGYSPLLPPAAVRSVFRADLRLVAKKGIRVAFFIVKKAT